MRTHRAARPREHHHNLDPTDWPRRVRAAVTATITNVGGSISFTPQPNRSWTRRRASPGPFGRPVHGVCTCVHRRARQREQRHRHSAGAYPTTAARPGSPIAVASSKQQGQFLPRHRHGPGNRPLRLLSGTTAATMRRNVRSEIWGTASIDGGADVSPIVKISTGASPIHYRRQRH